LGTRSRRAVGPTSIDEHVSGAPQVPPQERKTAQGLFRDDANLVRQRPEDDGNVVNALVIGDEDVRPIPLETFKSRDLHVDTGRDENQP